MNTSYLGDGLTHAVVFDWLGLGEMEDLDLGSVTCEGLLWLVEHAIPWPCLCVGRAGWLWTWGLTCWCEVDVFDFETVGFVNVAWGRVVGVEQEIKCILTVRNWLLLLWMKHFDICKTTRISFIRTLLENILNCVLPLKWKKWNIAAYYCVDFSRTVIWSNNTLLHKTSTFHA